MGLLDMIGLGGNKQDVAEMIQKGAVIIDVRSKGEFVGGHIKGSMNIPLDQLNNRVQEIKGFGKPIVTCCASGMRSGSAASALKKHGLEVVNGGGWMSLNSRLG